MRFLHNAMAMSAGFLSLKGLWVAKGESKSGLSREALLIQITPNPSLTFAQFPARRGAARNPLDFVPVILNLFQAITLC